MNVDIRTHIYPHTPRLRFYMARPTKKGTVTGWAQHQARPSWELLCFGSDIEDLKPESLSLRGNPRCLSGAVATSVGHPTISIASERNPRKTTRDSQLETSIPSIHWNGGKTYHRIIYQHHISQIRQVQRFSCVLQKGHLNDKLCFVSGQTSFMTMQGWVVSDTRLCFFHMPASLRHQFHRSQDLRPVRSVLVKALQERLSDLIGPYWGTELG